MNAQGAESKHVADSHLTYIQSAVPTRYDVYWRDGRGVQLGFVERYRGGWRAVDFEGRSADGDARWIAATWLWMEGDS